MDYDIFGKHVVSCDYQCISSDSSVYVCKGVKLISLCVRTLYSVFVLRTKVDPIGIGLKGC